MKKREVRVPQRLSVSCGPSAYSDSIDLPFDTDTAIEINGVLSKGTQERTKGKERWRIGESIFGSWKAKEKPGLSAVPFYDGLVESVVFSPASADYTNRDSGNGDSGNH